MEAKQNRVSPKQIFGLRGNKATLHAGLGFVRFLRHGSSRSNGLTPVVAPFD